MRVALIHDWLTGLRGGERCLDEIAARYPDADLYTLFHVPGSTSERIDRLNVHESRLARLPSARRHYRWLLPLYPWAIRGFRLEGYDLVISSHHAVAKGIRVAPGTPHLCYCYTPMRYVWDQSDAYLGRSWLRAASFPLAAALRRFDVSTSADEHVTRFVAISRSVAERIHTHYGREANVVHPPVRTETFAPVAAPRRGAYLLVGGFVPYKREALAIEAFRRSGARLVVAGDGPGRARLQRAAPPNVEFVGRVSDVELAELFAHCRALIYPQEEDFGLIAVEAQAAGRPVIAFGAGGALDTVVPLPGREGAGATGVFFHSPTPEALLQAIHVFEANEARFEPSEIRRNALRFSAERFQRELAEEVAATLAAASTCEPAGCEGAAPPPG